MNNDETHWVWTTLNGLQRAGPTAHVAIICLVVFGFSQAGRFIGIGPNWLSLGPDYMDRPWTLLTNVYAHASSAHLFGNMAAFALIGLILERFTTTTRFHLFFLLSGLFAGLAQVISGLFVPGSYLTLGASGAIFALYGYALTANPPVKAFLDWLKMGPLITAGLFVLIAFGATYYTAAPGVALVGHFTGFVIGLTSGRFELLDPDMTPALLKPYL